MTSCTTKTRYATEAFARQHLAIIAKKSKKLKKPCDTYQCPRCGAWHLTSRQDPSAKLKQEIAALKAEIEQLKKATAEEKTALKKDHRIVELTALSTSQQQTINRLRKDNNELILKLVQHGQTKLV